MDLERFRVSRRAFIRTMGLAFVAGGAIIAEQSVGMIRKHDQNATEQAEGVCYRSMSPNTLENMRKEASTKPDIQKCMSFMRNYFQKSNSLQIPIEIAGVDIAHVDPFKGGVVAGGLLCLSGLIGILASAHWRLAPRNRT